MDARYAAAYPDLYRNHWWWRVRERILLATIQRLVPSGHARILDVGCGAGLFFDSLEHFGEIAGIESDPTCIAQDSRWAHRIFCGELDESYAPSSRFDLILMLDVLEHVPRPHQLLRHAARILEPEGRILVTVPAFRWLWTAHDDMNHHARRYTLRELCSTIQECGLVVLESRYLFQSLVVPKLAVRLSETIALRPPNVPKIPRPALSAALQAWYWNEHHLLGWLPFGTSALAVAALSDSEAGQ